MSASPATPHADQPRPVRGMHDRFGIDARKHRHICQIGSEIAELYDFEQ
ncbi:hypothetical protein BC936DRAFT_145746, partial [Jimgerdemannia flammicorona]